MCIFLVLAGIFLIAMRLFYMYILCIYIYVYIYVYIYIYIYLYVPDEGSLLPKYRDCTTSNDFESYLMCCGVMLQ